MNKSSDLFRAAQQVIPGGVNSPVRAFKSVDRDPLFIKSANGCRITDADDKTYIDYVGSWGPMIVGHAHAEILGVLAETAALGTSFGAPTEGEIRIAEKIIDMVDSVDMVRLVNSGTEATMSAVRLARGYTRRDKIVKFDGCYHGHGDSFLVQAGSGALTLGEPNSPGVPADTVKDTVGARYNDLESVRAIFSKYPDGIAAVIVEPVAGNMGVIPPEPGFLQGLRQICTDFGALLILDEVMTGFRVHPGGAQKLYDVTPDLSTFGKIIGGGLPVGAYGGRREVMEMLAPSGPVYQAGTLSGNPLAVAAGLKTLEIITRPGFYEQLNAKSIAFFEETRKLIEQKNYPLSLNFVNSMGCLFFCKERVTGFSEAMQADTKLFTAFFGGMLDEGVYLAPSQFEAMFISAAHDDLVLEQTFTAMKKVLAKIFA